MKKKRVYKSPVVSLDTKRKIHEVSLECLFEDCRRQTKVKFADRINAYDDLICNACGRDFYRIQFEDFILDYYGKSWDVMMKDTRAAELRREKARRKK